MKRQSMALKIAATQEEMAHELGQSVPRSSVTGVQNAGGAAIETMLKQATGQLTELQQAVASIHVDLALFQVELNTDAMAGKYAASLVLYETERITV